MAVLNHHQGAKTSRWLFLVSLCLVGVPLFAQTLEYQVKAAFLLNFTKFVEWPATAFPSRDSSLNICVLGEDPFGRVLDKTAEGEVVSGHLVKVNRMSDLAAAKQCHVLFVSKSERERMPRIMVEVRSLPVLTVSELPGCIIQFVIEQRKVRFYINAKAAEAAGLRVSSRLLKVAKEVK